MSNRNYGAGTKRFAVAFATGLMVVAIVVASATTNAFAQTKNQYLKTAPGAQTPPPPQQPPSKDAKKAPKGTTLCQPPGASKPQPC
jgi:hypothetical protein